MCGTAYTRVYVVTNVAVLCKMLCGSCCRKRNEDMLPVRQRAEQIFKRCERSLMSFFVSRQWISKFNTFAEPGPINNYDFLCQHGGKLNKLTYDSSNSDKCVCIAKPAIRTSH